MGFFSTAIVFHDLIMTLSGIFFDGNRFSRSYYDIEWDFFSTAIVFHDIMTSSVFFSMAIVFHDLIMTSSGIFFDCNRLSRSYYDIEWDFMNTRYDENRCCNFLPSCLLLTTATATAIADCLRKFPWLKGSQLQVVYRNMTLNVTDITYQVVFLWSFLMRRHNSQKSHFHRYLDNLKISSEFCSGISKSLLLTFDDYFTCNKIFSFYKSPSHVRN